MTRRAGALFAGKPLRTIRRKRARARRARTQAPVPASKSCFCAVLCCLRASVVLARARKRRARSSVAHPRRQYACSATRVRVTLLEAASASRASRRRHARLRPRAARRQIRIGAPASRSCAQDGVAQHATSPLYYLSKRRDVVLKVSAAARDRARASRNAWLCRPPPASDL